jgi:hypothetical protein
MDTRKTIQSTLLITGALLYNTIFWHENLGVNLLLFSMFIVFTIIFLYREVIYSKPFIISTIGVLITGVFVIYHNSSMAKFTHLISLFLLVGFANQLKIKSIIYALPTAVINYFNVPRVLWNKTSYLNNNSTRIKTIWRYTKLTLVPFLILVVFYIIFLNANPVFEKLSDNIWNGIGKWFELFFTTFSFLRFLFFLWGLSIISWVIYKIDIPYFRKKEEQLSDHIKRKRIKVTTFEKSMGSQNINPSFPFLGLKNEFRSASILIISVNLLLMVVNAIDINWIWFNFKYDKSVNLSQFVHEGTYLLILSTLLSIGILLYFFRKNQNFSPYRKRLIILSSAWIVQNLILVISVGIRNYHYIHHYGLAYKRIGVIIFLTLTLIGLITLFIKIRNQKSTYYLLRWNSWSVYASFIFMSMVNWDGVIIQHNISHTYQQNIDIEFLLSLSDKTLPIIDQNKQLLFGRNWENGTTYDFENLYKLRVQNFLDQSKTTSWLSWNYKTNETLDYFNTENN